ncbi:hypothetical protein HYT54_03505 [Candidatus Woesearchaeota archaeon]|nr:hypothetical protein [Candidatus Woesearchaeota archaeon]
MKRFTQGTREPLTRQAYSTAGRPVNGYSDPIVDDPDIEVYRRGSTPYTVFVVREAKRRYGDHGDGYSSLFEELVLGKIPQLHGNRRCMIH